MAVTEIAHKPELTKEQARELFAKHFEGRYKVEKWKGLGTISRDFVIERNPFIAVTVKLEQGTNDTKFVYSGIAPKLWARLLVSGLLSYFLWNGLTREVRTFIESAPEFK